MDSDDNYSVEFEDGSTQNEIPEAKSESPVKNDSVEKHRTNNGKTRKKNNGYKTNRGRTCRICLKRCKRQSKDASEFVETYLKCTGFSLKNGQGPTKICYPCLHELFKVENFISKCSETEHLISKGLVSKNVGSDEDDISDVSDIDELKVPKLPKKLGRPPFCPSKSKVVIPKASGGRPRGNLENIDRINDCKARGRPKNSFKVKLDPEFDNDNVTDERQICFVCGKLVTVKHLPYHLWKHRKDKEIGTTTTETNSLPQCEYCHKVYKSEDGLKTHMKRVHPAVDEMQSKRDESPEPEMIDDNFEKEFHVPTKDEYSQIQSPYNHVQALGTFEDKLEKE